MIFATIIFISLILQCIAVYYFFRLIFITGHTRAWLLLSLGITTMAARRFIALVTELFNQTPHHLMNYSFEITGILGSAMMVAGVILIKPLFIMIKNAEEEQRALAMSLKEALSNVKVLKELLPICAICKKIRDDDGYWQQIETYITNNSDTYFSHGICPDCCKKLYPDQHERMLPGKHHD
ncbi:MAG: hypothetical protein PHD01_17155 [Geobacteraceae bacterium]|nr:hypothetical protein [Geobacteraceae bacterium]